MHCLWWKKLKWYEKALSQKSGWNYLSRTWYFVDRNTIVSGVVSGDIKVSSFCNAYFMLLCVISMINISRFSLWFLKFSNRNMHVQNKSFNFKYLSIVDSQMPQNLTCSMLIYRSDNSPLIKTEFIFLGGKDLSDSLQQPFWVEENQRMRTVVIALPSLFIPLDQFPHLKDEGLEVHSNSLSLLRICFWSGTRALQDHS